MNAPGADDYLSKYFWQYAVIKQEAASNNLKYITTHEISCSAIPIGEEVDDTLYSAGQKSSPDFDKKVKELKECQEGPYDWNKAVMGWGEGKWTE